MTPLKRVLELSVVIPIFNEVDIIAELCQRLKDTLEKLSQSYEIILVDDGSRDGSSKLLKELQAKDPRLVTIELARNHGQTAALAAGIDHAHGAIIVTMDGDLQHQPEEIPRFLTELEQGFDVVSGWRKVRTDNPLLRRIPSYLANLIMRRMSGIPIRDFGSTYKAYRAEILKQVELFGELHRFIPVLAYKAGARITEIPIEVHPRTQGSSKYGISRAFGVFEDLVFLEFYSNYLTKPIRAFGRLFFAFFGVGFLISFCLMVLWCLGVVSAVVEHGALLLFSVFLMIVGIQFLVAGILAEVLSRIYLNTSNRKIYALRAVHRT